MPGPLGAAGTGDAGRGLLIGSCAGMAAGLLASVFRAAPPIPLAEPAPAAAVPAALLRGLEFGLATSISALSPLRKPPK